jgi:hypothetical protein
MKRTLLFFTVFSIVMVLSGCGIFRDSLEQHYATLSRYDNYVMTLDSSIEVSGQLTTSKVYYYTDNEYNAVCITTYDPNNLLEQNDQGETPFSCTGGMQVEIDGSEYYYDGTTAVAFADSAHANLEEIFTAYFDLDTYDENDRIRTYEVTLPLSELDYAMQQVIGITPEMLPYFETEEVTITLIYSEREDRFTELKVDYKEYVNAYYDYLGKYENATKAYISITFDYFDKKYALNTAVTDDKIDDYPDSLGTAELVGYTIIEDAGSIEASFLNTNDNDLFQLTASGPNQYQISIEVPGSEIVYYTVADYNGGVVKSGTFDAVIGYEFTLELIEGGVYYIFVNPGTDLESELDYTITVE